MKASAAVLFLGAALAGCERDVATASERVDSRSLGAHGPARGVITAPNEATSPPPPASAEPRAATPRASAESSPGAMGLAVGDAGRAGAVIRGIGTQNESLSMLEPGDLVRSIDGVRVRDGADARRRLDHAIAGTLVLLEVQRRDGVHLVGIQAPGDVARVAPLEAPPALPPPAPRVVVVVPPTNATPAYVADQMPAVMAYATGDLSTTGASPPSYAAPGLPQTPGATFAPAPGTLANAFPQPPGVTLPPQFPANLAQAAPGRASAFDDRGALGGQVNPLLGRSTVPGASDPFASPAPAVGTPAANAPGAFGPFGNAASGFAPGNGFAGPSGFTGNASPNGAAAPQGLAPPGVGAPVGVSR